MVVVVGAAVVGAAGFVSCADMDFDFGVSPLCATLAVARILAGWLSEERPKLCTNRPRNTRAMTASTPDTKKKARLRRRASPGQGVTVLGRGFDIWPSDPEGKNCGPVPAIQKGGSLVETLRGYWLATEGGCT